MSKPSMKIVATILAKNEADIIGKNIEHHISQGVSQFIVTNNNSTDNTREIVEKYPEVVELIDESGTDHRQSEWVTRMARIACQLNPDWIIHLDADELWSGFSFLKQIDSPAVGCTRVFLHPPTKEEFGLQQMRYYLDFSKCNIPEECKVAHRPSHEVVIAHGNHSCNLPTTFTTNIWRHHYPVRSPQQFVRKAVEGHKALESRNAICERWASWNSLNETGQLLKLYEKVCDEWLKMQKDPNTESLIELMKFWSTPDVIEFFKQSHLIPEIGEWPKL